MARRWGWADMDPEILDLVTARLGTASNLIRFGGVCRSWRRAARAIRRLPRLPPLLVLPTGDYDDGSTVSFFSPFSGRAHAVQISQVCGYAVCGSSAGWLVFINTKLDSFVYDPLTGTKITLPSSRSGGSFLRALGLKRYEIQNWEVGAIPEVIKCYPFMGRYTVDPSDCVIVFAKARADYHHSHSRFVFCRLHDGGWTQVSARLPDFSFQSILYHMGKFFCLDASGSPWVWDMQNDAGGSFRIIHDLPIPFVHYMVLLEDDFLLIHQISECEFQIHLLYETDAGNWGLSLLEELGDRAILLHRDHPSAVVDGIANDGPTTRPHTLYWLQRCCHSEELKEMVRACNLHIANSEVLQEVNLGSLPLHRLHPSLNVCRCMWFTPIVERLQWW